ncbi:MAG: transposase [Janthinobacterium lividum]
MQPYRQVTDEEWARVEPLIPELKYNPTRDPRGRPMTSRRDCLNATIWVMYSGASWQNLPRRYPSYQTCHRSFKAWYDAGVLHRIAHTLFGAAAHNFLEVVSARIRSGTKARQALNAAAAAGAAATGKPPSGRKAASGVRGNRRKKITVADKVCASGKRANGARTLAAQVLSAGKAAPHETLDRKVPDRKALDRKALDRKVLDRKALAGKPAVCEPAVRKTAAAQGSAGADRGGASRARTAPARTAPVRTGAARAAAEEGVLSAKRTPRDMSDEPLSGRKAGRASGRSRSQEMTGSA